MSNTIEVPLIEVSFKKDNYTTLTLIVPPQELAVLSVINGPGLTEIGPVGRTKHYDSEEEYDRLMRVYGVDKKRNLLYVERAFGERHETRLADTMRKAVKHYATKDKPATKAKRVTKAASDGEDVKAVA